MIFLRKLSKVKLGMAVRTNGNSITIDRETIQKKRGIVVLTLEEYQELRERVVPNYYLKGKEADKLDRLVEEGLREYRKGKLREIKSLAELD